MRLVALGFVTVAVLVAAVACGEPAPSGAGRGRATPVAAPTPSATGVTRSSRGVGLSWATGKLMVDRDLATIALASVPPSAIAPLFRRSGCAAGNDARCAELAQAAARCDAGEAGECFAVMVKLTTAVRAPLLELAAARRACVLFGDGSPQCAHATWLLGLMRRTPDALRAASDACLGDDTSSTTILGCAVAAGSLPTDRRKDALAFATRACTHGVVGAGGCADVALWSTDAARVREALETACKLGSADGCWVLGHFLAGECGQACAKPTDPAAAKQAFATACRLAAGHEGCRDGQTLGGTLAP